jgi:hypothetical protein
MSLSAKVTAAVNKAFTSAGDLVKQGTLSTKAVSGYNFGTRETVSTTTSANVDVILQSTQKPSGEGFTTTAIMKSGVNISVYDTLTVGSKVYNIVDYTDNEFTIEAILTKETQ